MLSLNLKEKPDLTFLIIVFLTVSYMYFYKRFNCKVNSISFPIVQSGRL